jgi:hypothetical protein
MHKLEGGWSEYDFPSTLADPQMKFAPKQFQESVER